RGARLLNTSPSRGPCASFGARSRETWSIREEDPRANRDRAFSEQRKAGRSGDQARERRAVAGPHQRGQRPRAYLQRKAFATARCAGRRQEAVRLARQVDLRDPRAREAREG